MHTIRAGLLGSILMVTLGCGAPTPKPAAMSLDRVIATQSKQDPDGVFCYTAVLHQGNIESLESFGFGSLGRTPLLTVDTTKLHAEEITPLGIDPAGFLVTYGPQGLPDGTLQVADLGKGRTFKAIGTTVSDLPWRMVAFRPPHTFLGLRNLAEGTSEATLRYQKGAKPSISVDAGHRPDHWYGFIDDTRAIYSTDSPFGSTLWLLDATSGKVTQEAAFDHPLTSVLVVAPKTPGSVSLGGYALTHDAQYKVVELFRWHAGAKPQLLADRADSEGDQLVPTGWPCVIPQSHLAFWSPHWKDSQALTGLYLFDGFTWRLERRLPGSGGTSERVPVAWLVDPDHLCWQQGSLVQVAPLSDAVAQPSTIAELPPGAEWAIFPGPAALP